MVSPVAEEVWTLFTRFSTFCMKNLLHSSAHSSSDLQLLSVGSCRIRLSRQGQGLRAPSQSSRRSRRSRAIRRRRRTSSTECVRPCSSASAPARGARTAGSASFGIPRTAPSQRATPRAEEGQPSATAGTCSRSTLSSRQRGRSAPWPARKGGRQRGRRLLLHEASPRRLPRETTTQGGRLRPWVRSSAPGSRSPSLVNGVQTTSATGETMASARDFIKNLAKGTPSFELNCVGVATTKKAIRSMGSTKAIGVDACHVLSGSSTAKILRRLSP